MFNNITGVEEEQIIMLTKFGSHLYGTDNLDSDTDYKGVYLPTKRQILLGNAPDSIKANSKAGSSAKNTSEDVDFELYSLHYFLKMACEGDTGALDMLHAPDNMIIKQNGIWTKIQLERERFYTKNLKSFVGYARKQASKYGIKGSRLSDARKVRDFLFNKMPLVEDMRLGDCWGELPEGEFIFKDERKDPMIYEVCGRKMQHTSKVAYCFHIVNKFTENYGDRARQAANNEGIDWKAVSHATRAAYQMIELYDLGTINFPLEHRDYLREVKEGKHDYMTVVAPKLEMLMDELEVLAKNSDYPEEVNQKFWDDWLVKLLEMML